MTTEKTERARRSVPPRTGPIRSAASFSRPGHIPGRAAPQAGPDGVERAVENAYRVLDEQLLRGEEVARAHRSRRGIAVDDLAGLPRSMMRVWSDVLGLWLDLLGPLAPPGLRSALRGAAQEPPPPAPSYAPPPAPAPAQQAAWTRVTLDVSTTRPVEVDVELSPDAALDHLVVQDLGAFDGGGKPPITGARLGPGRDGRPVLRLAVAPDQPPGTYLGMILDSTRAEQRGTLRVVVRA